MMLEIEGIKVECERASFGHSHFYSTVVTAAILEGKARGGDATTVCCVLPVACYIKIQIYILDISHKFT